MRSTPFVMEAVEQRTLMSVAVMQQEPAVIVTDVHARSVESGQRLVMRSGRLGHGVVTEYNQGGSPSKAPSKGPSAGVNRNIIPPAITGLVAAPLNGGTVSLQWTKAHAAADTIVVDYSSDGTHYTTLGMLDDDVTSFKATGLESGKTYSFKLWAMNKKGMSPASEIVSITLG